MIYPCKIIMNIIVVTIIIIGVILNKSKAYDLSYLDPPRPPACYNTGDNCTNILEEKNWNLIASSHVARMIILMTMIFILAVKI